MAKKYLLTTRTISITQILIVSFLIITVPALWLAASTINTIENQLDRHIHYFQTNEIDTIPEKSKNLVRIGNFLRSKKLPFTNTEILRNTNNDLKLAAWSENLKNAKVAIAYSWALIILIWFVTYLSVGVFLNKSFNKLSVDIQALNSDTKNQAISIGGPADTRNLSEDLENLRLKLYDNEQQQQAFLRHISHEIKTPLTAIKEGATLLNENILGEMTKDQESVTEILVKSSCELQTAIENLLSYNSMASSNAQKNREPTELSTLVNESLEKHELTIKHKQLTIKLELEEVIAFVDARQIVTVFENLISNAIKHSPQEGSIQLWLQKKKGGKAGFIIKDCGTGVSNSQKNSIFKAFFIGDNVESSTLKGTGLGLSIAKQYVNNHHGEIKLLSSRSGAVFQVTLPINS